MIPRGHYQTQQTGEHGWEHELGNYTGTPRRDGRPTRMVAKLISQDKTVKLTTVFVICIEVRPPCSQFSGLTLRTVWCTPSFINTDLTCTGLSMILVIFPSIYWYHWLTICDFHFRQVEGSRWTEQSMKSTCFGQFLHRFVSPVFLFRKFIPHDINVLQVL